MKIEKRELDYCNNLSLHENYLYTKNMDNCFDKDTDDYLRPKIYKLLPKIDKELGGLEVDLSKRSFIATKELFDKGLIKFRATNGNKLSEELKDKAFSIIHIFVNDWFITKYGNINHDTDMISHIIINGVSYEIKVPLCICKPTGDNETAWLSFLSIIQNDENIISWLKNVPNLNFLSELDISNMNNDLIKNASNIRKINTSFISIGKLSVDEDNTYKNIISSLETTSNLFLSDTKNSSGILWNIHFAVEACLKFCFLRNKTEIIKDHDLAKLHKALFHTDDIENVVFLNEFPYQKITSERYFCTRSISELNNYYILALEYISYLLDRQDKIINIEDLAIKIKYAFAI